MNRSVRTAVCALAAAGLAVGLTACSEAADRAVDQVDKAVSETYQVTYEVTGEGVDSIDYHADGGTAMDPKIETVQKPELPWKKTVTLKGIVPPAVMPVAVDAAGAEVTCSITYKGEVIKESKGEGIATAGGCVAVSPIAR
ncbi:MmpS family transport accessory protein [Streptomyces sp. WMMC940]|uniref:MmpS family transport accessory protein n=1 Tax=Streptomyces sp. WMMC940 TaxID=3015153 RepID=UPI0022B70F80|nr:MmpS family transport accessory protein [Streptomyces sp. WMMC940]MCZ7458491.1 MmpS family transport accessory protein [Streptomyces sp. WMMC940]